jgi:hypothetical protein
MGPAPARFLPGRMIAAALCALLLAAGCGSGKSGPSPTNPATETFVSDRYDFSVVLPSGSVSQDATVDWDGSCLCGLGSPVWASASVEGRSLVVAATAADPDMDLRRWRTMMVGLAPSSCHDSEDAIATTLGGADALQWTASCSDGYHVIKLAALHDGRGYVVLLASPTSERSTDNQKTFDALIGSFTFVGP